MNILLIVNESPWGSTLANAALRFLRAAPAAGHRISMVYFRGEGVYNALGGRVTDAGAVDLSAEWVRLGREQGADLLLCSSAAGRRLSRQAMDSVDAAYREAGLAELLSAALRCDRVVTF